MPTRPWRGPAIEGSCVFKFRYWGTMSTASRLQNAITPRAEPWEWLPLGIVSVDCDGVVVETSGRLDLLFGPSAAQWPGRSLGELLGAGPFWQRCLYQARAGQPAAGVVELADRWLAVRMSPQKSASGEVNQIVVALLDLGEKAAFFGVSCSYRAISDLVEQIEAYRRELRLIGYEIHDGLVQYLTAAQMHLEDRMVRAASEGKTIAPEQLGAALKHVRSALTEARRLINGLRPPVLEQGGLVAAVQELLSDDSMPVPEITLVVDRLPEQLDPLLESVVYRIVQEAVSNLRRHSGAEEAVVRLSRLDRWIQLEVRDFGKGFDSQVLRRGAVGLKSILHRAELAGGWAVVDSHPGRGTRVFVSVPMVGGAAITGEDGR